MTVEQTPTTETSETPTEPTEAPAPEGQEPEAPKAETNAEQETLEQKIARLESEAAETRREAANYRTKARDLGEQLKAAKSPEEFATAVAEYEQKLAAAELATAREGIIRNAKLTDDYVEFLTGSTVEELTASAEKLAKLQSLAAKSDNEEIDPARLGGGLNGTPIEEEFDAREIARRERRKRR